MSWIDKNKFWQWAYSDFLSNAARGVLAEYIVGTALDCLSQSRKEWDAYDLVSKGGAKIEVKSSSYLQSWPQQKPSEIRFDIAEKRSWFAASNTHSSEALRSADIYVFCILEEKDKTKVDPLDLNQWFFIVLAVNDIQERLGKQKTVALTTLQNIGGQGIRYPALVSEVQRVWERISHSQA